MLDIRADKPYLTQINLIEHVFLNNVKYTKQIVYE